MILCCKCGSQTPPSTHNMCFLCCTTHTDIISSIKKHLSVKYCKKCDRYHQPPNSWLRFNNSTEFLSFLIKNNCSLKKYNINNATFLFTEEHSKRIEIEVSVSPFTYDGLRSEAKVLIKYRVEYTQCRECALLEDKQFWQSIVQIRQNNKIKNTFLDLEEQLMGVKLVLGNIKQLKNGVDFEFSNLIDATKLINYLKSNYLCTINSSSKLISQDTKSNICYFKNSFSVQLCPLNTFDLVLIDPILQRHLNFPNLLLITSITTKLTLTDPYTFKTFEITNAVFWKYKNYFQVLCAKNDVKTLLVIDKIDLENNFRELFFENGLNCRTQLKINVGDDVNVYDLSSLNIDFKFKYNIVIVEEDEDIDLEKINIINI